jgi:hypothetical protein
MRRFAFVGFLLASVSVSGCAATHPAPVFDAEANRSLKLPDALSKPGAQARIRLPGQDVFLLIWRTEIGFGGTDLVCPHCRKDLVFNSETQSLGCPSGIRYRLDGSYLDGQIRQGEVVRPLRTYLVDLDGTRLKILG